MSNTSISLVTAVYNRADSVNDTVASVSQQCCQKIEYIVVDGMSNDGTSEKLAAHSDVITRLIREPDDGIYDALNKGIEAATADVVGFLHADDLLAASDILTKVAEKFDEGGYDIVYGDLLYVDSDDTSKIKRYWKSGNFNRRRFRFGWMPPHPTVYVKKEVYERFGHYRIDLGSAADYECMVRLLYKNEFRVGYLPKIIVKMRVGGESNASLGNRMRANRADRMAWLENGLTPPFGLRFTKPLSKIGQYFRRP